MLTRAFKEDLCPLNILQTKENGLLGGVNQSPTSGQAHRKGDSRNSSTGTTNTNSSAAPWHRNDKERRPRVPHTENEQGLKASVHTLSNILSPWLRLIHVFLKTSL